jgi:hypothetical protein
VSALALLLAFAAQQSDYPALEAYRLCGVREADRLDRASPRTAPATLARRATAHCEPLLAPAARETAEKARQPAGDALVKADFRRRSIADLTQKVAARRAAKRTGSGGSIKQR